LFLVDDELTGCVRLPWCRFICRYAMGYFPISLHVEDFKAFDPTRAYGELPFPIMDAFIIIS
jgi:hypothetical protein